MYEAEKKHVSERKMGKVYILTRTRLNYFHKPLRESYWCRETKDERGRLCLCIDYRWKRVH